MRTVKWARYLFGSFLSVFSQISCPAHPFLPSCTLDQPETEDDTEEECSEDVTDHVVSGEVIAVVVKRVEKCRKCEENPTRHNEKHYH